MYLPLYFYYVPKALPLAIYHVSDCFLPFSSTGTFIYIQFPQSFITNSGTYNLSETRPPDTETPLKSPLSIENISRLLLVRFFIEIQIHTL